jgi:SNF2 family DNA or RNA helicase
MLTTDGIIQTRKDDSPLFTAKWSRLICDEAHHMRNKKKLFTNIMKLKAEIKWVMTGTPIQNRGADLGALCSIIGLDDAIYAKGSDTREIIHRHSLRRTKKQVGIKLPPIVTHLIMVPWKSAEEKQFCADIHAQVRFPQVTVKNVNRVMSFLGKGALAWFTRLRQVSILPHLLQDKIETLIREGAIDSANSLKHIKTASKMSAVLKVLKERKGNGRRKLVFCHYHGEIDLLRSLLKKMGVNVSVIDGRVPTKERKFTTMRVPSAAHIKSVCHTWKNIPGDILSHIDEFMAPEVCLVQIKTASEGLNLQHFQEIYFTSPWWNPALEDQAVARAHRIGQNHKVDVFRFAMNNFGGDSLSLDQYCILVQSTKRELMDYFEKQKKDIVAT